MSHHKVPTMADLTQEQLRSLYFRFVAYRDNQCGGWSDMGVVEFHAKTWGKA